MKVIDFDLKWLPHTTGVIHGLLSHDKRYKSLKKLWQKLGLSLESKRIKTLFGVNAALDAGMLGVFLFVT